MAKKIFLPEIKNEEKIPDPPDSDENILFELLRTSPFQKRTHFIRHPLLDLAARNKAIHMAENDYYAHTSPAGVTANENVRAVGYPLPDFYPIKGNNVESLSGGSSHPQYSVDAWLESPKHRPHVFGEDPFYRNQECIGIGSSIPPKDGRKLYVFISAACS